MGVSPMHWWHENKGETPMPQSGRLCGCFRQGIVMITEQRELVDIELDEFELIFKDEVVDRLPPDVDCAGLAALPRATADETESESCSTPQVIDGRVVFHRAIKTVTPLVLADVMALVLCGYAAMCVAKILFPEVAAHYGRIAPFALLPLIAVYAIAGLYTEIWVHPILELRTFSHLNTIALLAAAAGSFTSPAISLWFAVAWIFVMGVVPMFRSLARHACSRYRWWGHPTLVIGAGYGAAMLAQVLQSAPRSGLRPVLVTDPTGKCRSAVTPVLNDVTMLESLVRAEGIRHAVVSLPELSTARMGEVLDRFSGIIPHVLVLSDVSTMPTLWGASGRSGRLAGIEVRNSLLLATLGVVKRTFDLVIASGALLVGLPLLVTLAILVKLTSRGPIFFGHTRIGQHGKRFKAWKFRSMHVNADALLREHLEKVATAHEEWGRDQKLRRDPRVTRIGNLMRKTSLDELPQIWNVLKGDMSLVGPRPIVQSEVIRYGRVFRLYTSVKPGITGLWQVSGRNDLSYDERVQLDQFYVRHWSPWMDTYILGRTVITLLCRTGAY
jgi:Undecaprenyl-phosphate galactose phosphotransferase WbaP